MWKIAAAASSKNACVRQRGLVVVSAAARGSQMGMQREGERGSDGSCSASAATATSTLCVLCVQLALSGTLCNQPLAPLVLLLPPRLAVLATVHYQ